MELSLVYGKRDLESEFEEVSYCYSFNLIDSETIIWGNYKDQRYRTKTTKTIEEAEKLFQDIYNDGNNSEFIKDYKLTRITRKVIVENK